MLRLRRAAPARRPRVRGAAPAQNLASSRSRRPASEAPCEAARLRLATARDAIHRRASIRNARATSVSLGTSPGHASPSARASANNTGTPCERDHRARVDARHDGTRPRRMLSTPATLRPPRAGGVAPRHSQSGAQRACSGRGMRFRPPPSAQGYVRGARARWPERAQRAPPSSGGAASRSPRPPARGRSSTREGRARGRARRAYARPRRCARSGGGAGPRDTAHARRLTRSPCSSSVARAASSAFAGQPRSRETSAISASATTHLARATASFGPKARAARRRRAFARTRSPSCAIAMPRSARAGASSRRATRFNAPRDHPPRVRAPRR